MVAYIGLLTREIAKKVWQPTYHKSRKTGPRSQVWCAHAPSEFPVSCAIRETSKVAEITDVQGSYHCACWWPSIDQQVLGDLLEQRRPKSCPVCIRDRPVKGWHGSLLILLWNREIVASTSPKVALWRQWPKWRGPVEIISLRCSRPEVTIPSSQAIRGDRNRGSAPLLKQRITIDFIV